MPSANKDGVFYGWRIVGVSFLAQFLAMGCSISIFGLFIPVLTSEFGASTMEANLGLSILTIFMAGSGAVIGPMLDKRSIRGVMISGTVLASVSFFLMSMATELWQLALLFGVGIAIGAAMFGPLAANTVVAKWFSQNRGKAVGIASMGAPTGGFLLAPLIGFLLADSGWRDTLVIISAMHLTLIPLLWLVIRNQPEDLGLTTDGIETIETEVLVQGRIWTTAQVFRAPNFWFLALAFGVAGVVAGSWNANVIPYSGDIGIGVDKASFFPSALGGTALLGTLIFGTLADKISIRLLLWSSFLMQGASFIFIRLIQPDFTSLMAAILVFGLAAGAMMPLMAAAIGRGFGPASFGRVMGFIGPVTLPFGFIGPPLVGYIRDVTGSYILAFDLFLVIFVLASLILLGLKLPSIAKFNEQEGGALEERNI